MGKLTSKRKPATKTKRSAKELASLRLKPPSKTIEELARQQGVKPITSFEELNKLGAGFPEDDIEAFITFIESERAKERRALRKKKGR